MSGVRCGTCRHWAQDGEGLPYCGIGKLDFIDADSACADGWEPVVAEYKAEDSA